MPQVSTTLIVAFSSFMSLGSLCAPAPPPQPPPQEDLSEVYRKLFAQQYSSIEPMITDILGKVEMEEANYQDWHSRTDDKGKQLATYSVVTKKHEELVARTAALKADHDAWVAFYEANKANVRTEEECRKFSNDGDGVRKAVDQLHRDYISLRGPMSQISR